MARHLVTGCAGFVGSHLCDALLAQGDEVVGVDRAGDGRARANLSVALGHPGFRLVAGDLCDLALGPLISDCDGVFHLGARPGVRGSWGERFEGYARDNLVATQRVAESASRAGVRMVWASSSSVYGDAARHPTGESEPLRPISPYGVTKQACESIAAAYAATHGLDVVTLRLFTVYGPRQRPDMAFSRAIASAQEGVPFTVLGDGSQTREVTYVHDAVRAAQLAMQEAPSGGVYNVGGGTEVALIDCLRAIERIGGRPLRLAFAATAAGDAGRTGADTGAARRDLGWAPLVGLDEGLTAQIAAPALTVG